MKNIVVKLDFTKSKAFCLCGTILMAAFFSTVAVRADEVKTSDSTQKIEAVAKVDEAAETAKADETAKAETAQTETAQTEKAETVVNEEIEPKVPTLTELEKPAEPEKLAESEKSAEPEKPTSEIPAEAPIADVPEYNEQIGTVPLDSPVLEKPKYNEPIVTKPWRAPVLHSPELKMSETLEKLEESENERPRTTKDNIYREVKVIKSHKSEHENIDFELDKSELSIKPVRVASNDSNLPSTGEKSSSTLKLIGAAVLSVLAAGLYLFRKKHQ